MLFWLLMSASTLSFQYESLRITVICLDRLPRGSNLIAANYFNTSTIAARIIDTTVQSLCRHLYYPSSIATT
jgi:hypothetical protein